MRFILLLLSALAATGCSTVTGFAFQKEWRQWSPATPAGTPVGARKREAPPTPNSPWDGRWAGTWTSSKHGRLFSDAPAGGPAQLVFTQIDRYRYRAHFRVERSGNIGLPAPGVSLKLVPNESKLEVRVKGPNVMQGYLNEPELTKHAFDDEGYYRIGDAVRFAEEGDPASGLVFDGRVAEDFKLASGTWVSVTSVRTGVVAAAAGLLADVVVCGHDREYLALLAWASVGACLALVGRDDPIEELVNDDAVRARVREGLMAWNAKNSGSSTRIQRLLLLCDPPSIDAGEITDKGYTNQRAVVMRRAADVERVYDPVSDESTIDVRVTG